MKKTPKNLLTHISSKIAYLLQNSGKQTKHKPSN